MRKVLVYAALMLGICGVSSVRAADATMSKETRATELPPNCQNLWRCSPAGCDWHRVCSRPCPDGYSCAPLYGAYGPYGGTAYWGSYTASGWGTR
jgi:hypothetical protein